MPAWAKKSQAANIISTKTITMDQLLGLTPIGQCILIIDIGTDIFMGSLIMVYSVWYSVYTDNYVINRIFDILQMNMIICPMQTIIKVLSHVSIAEGSECQALTGAGAKDFFNTVFVPYIMMEWSLGLRAHEVGSPCSAQDINAMIQDLYSRGFSAYNYKGQQLDMLTWNHWPNTLEDIIWKHHNAEPLW